MNSTGKPTVHTVPRPYILAYEGTDTTYPISSEEAQRLLDECRIVAATSGSVTLRADDGHTTTILPATRGGGPAFEVTR